MFDRPDIADAIKLCYERSDEFIVDYLESNFRLDASAERRPQVQVPAPLVEQHAQPGASMDQVLDETPHPQQAGDTARTWAEDREATEGEEVVNSDLGEDELDAERGPLPTGEVPVVRLAQRTVRPAQTSLIERFARAMGFSRDGVDSFVDPDGRGIHRSSMLFPWQLQAPTGEVIRYYWLQDHCLERAPLQLEADVWSAFDRHPDLYALVLVDLDGRPYELTGQRLKGMAAEGHLALYPATYRLAYRADPE